MTPIKRLACVFHRLLLEGRVTDNWLITMVELVVRSNQADVERMAEGNTSRAQRLAEQLVGDEVHLFQRALTPHNLSEERHRLERREAALLTQAGWVQNPTNLMWHRGTTAANTAAALNIEYMQNPG